VREGSKEEKGIGGMTSQGESLEERKIGRVPILTNSTHGIPYAPCWALALGL